MRLAQLSGDDWLGVVSCLPGRAPSWLQIVESTNTCRSWTPIAEIKESGRYLDNGNLLVMADGSVLLGCRSLIKGESYRLPVYRSVDRGQTWSALSNIDNNEGPPRSLVGKGLWEPHLFVLPDGRLSVIYSNEKHAGYSQILSQKISDDGGRTWGEESRIVEQPQGGGLRPGMGVPAQMADGRFILVYEIVGLGKADVHFKISKDGSHWPEDLGTPLKDQHAAPFVVALTDGTLLVTSCSHQLSASADGGQTWQSLGPIWSMPYRFTWPALYEIGPSRLASVISNPEIQLRFGTWESVLRK